MKLTPSPLAQKARLIMAANAVFRGQAQVLEGLDIDLPPTAIHPANEALGWYARSLALLAAGDEEAATACLEKMAAAPGGKRYLQRLLDYSSPNQDE